MFGLLKRKEAHTHELAGIPLRTERCRVCEGLVVTGVRSKHLGGWVDCECIPAIVKGRGLEAVTRWLLTGEFGVD